MPLPSCQCNAGQPTQQQLANIYCALLDVIANSGSGFTPPLLPSLGGTGVANLDTETFTLNGGFPLAFTLTGATGVTLPTTGTLVTLAGNEALSNKTLTAPQFVDLGFIADASGGEMLVFDSVAGAVNNLRLRNAATGSGPLLIAEGDDGDVSLQLSGGGAGGIDLLSPVFCTDTLDATNAITGGALNTAGNLTFGTVGGGSDAPCADGTYPLPTSITTRNGVITAIS